jgi:hypothetical protein
MTRTQPIRLTPLPVDFRLYMPQMMNQKNVAFDE